MRFMVKPCDAVAARMILRASASLRCVEVWRFEDESRESTYRALTQCSQLLHCRVGEQGLPFLTRNTRLQSIAVDTTFLDPEAELVYFSAFTSFKFLQKVVLQNTTREGLEIILVHSPSLKTLRFHCLSGIELQSLEHARSLTSLSLIYFKEAFMPNLAKSLSNVATCLTSLDLEYARKKEGLGIHHLTRLVNLANLSINCRINLNLQAHTQLELENLSHFQRLKSFKLHCDIMDGDMYNHIRCTSLESLNVKSTYYYAFFPLKQGITGVVWTHLTTLHLVKVMYTNAMCHAISHATSLVHIKIQECKNVVPDLYRCLARLPTLRRIDLGFIYVMDSSHDDMIGIIATCPQLEHLTLTECHDITWVGIARFLKCTTLKRLEINFLQESRKSQQEIYAIFKNKPHLCVIVNSKWGEQKNLFI